MSDPIRDLFHREAATIEPERPDAAAVTSAGRKRLRRRRASTAALSLLVAAAVAGGVQLTGRDGPPPASAGKRLSVAARVELASSWSSEHRGVGDLAYGFGHLWAVSAQGPTLQRIDPATNGVVDVVPLGTSDRGLFWHVEAGFGRLWLTVPHRDRLLVVDPQSGEVTDQVDGIAGAMDVFATNEHLWVQAGDFRGAFDEMIHRVDPETLEVVGSVRMGAECCVSGMVEHEGYLWVAHSDVANRARDPEASHDDVGLDLALELRKVDPESMEVVDTIPLPGDTYRPGDTVLGDLTAAAGHLWVSRPDARAVDRVDPDRRIVESLDLGDRLRPDGVTYFDGAIWAWEINGSRTVPIDPAGLEIGPTSDLEEDMSGRPVEGAGSLWTAVQPDVERTEHVLRIDTPDTPRQTSAPPPEPVPPARGDVVEPIDEREGAEIFAFRALADTGLMRPFSPRSYNVTYEDDTTRAGGGWRIGLAASDCEPKNGIFTCTGLSGEHPGNGNPVTDTYVTVQLDGDRWMVTGVDGNMPQHDRDRIIGYSSRQEPEPSHWEFPAAAVWPTGHGFMVEMVALWVGPYPSEAPGSVCETRMLDAAGEPAGEPYRFYQEPPNRPFERGGWGRALDLEPFDGDAERVVVECFQRGDAP